MTQVVLDLDVVEEEVLKKLLDMGLFESPQEAFKIALLKYAMDLGDTKDLEDTNDPTITPNLNKLALKAAPEKNSDENNDESDDSIGGIGDSSDSSSVSEKRRRSNPQDSDLEEKEKPKGAGD